MGWDEASDIDEEIDELFADNEVKTRALNGLQCREDRRVYFVTDALGLESVKTIVQYLHALAPYSEDMQIFPSLSETVEKSFISSLDFDLVAKYILLKNDFYKGIDIANWRKYSKIVERVGIPSSPSPSKRRTCNYAKYKGTRAVASMYFVSIGVKPSDHGLCEAAFPGVHGKEVSRARAKAAFYLQGEEQLIFARKQLFGRNLSYEEYVCGEYVCNTVIDDIVSTIENVGVGLKRDRDAWEKECTKATVSTSAYVKDEEGEAPVSQQPAEAEDVEPEPEPEVEIDVVDAEPEVEIDVVEPEPELEIDVVDAEPKYHDNRVRMVREYKNSILLVRKWRSVPLHYPTWVGLLVVSLAFHFAAVGTAAALDEAYWGTRVSFSIAACVWCLCATPSKFDWVVALTSPFCHYVGLNAEDTYGLNYSYVAVAIIVGELNAVLGAVVSVVLMLITESPLRFAFAYIAFQNKRMNEANCLPTILLSPLRDIILIVYSIVTGVVCSA